MVQRGLENPFQVVKDFVPDATIEGHVTSVSSVTQARLPFATVGIDRFPRTMALRVVLYDYQPLADNSGFVGTCWCA